MLSSRLMWSFPLAALIGLAACSSKVTSALDTNLQAKVDTVTKCLPPQIEKLDELLEFSKLWRQNDNTNNPPDPAGLTWSYDGTTVTYSIALGSYTISGIIQFYSPTGAVQSLTLNAASSLSILIDDAATQLRNNTTNPFMVGDWTVAGANVSSAGGTSSPCAFTGIIGGATNANELEEVRSTEGTAMVSGGTPAIQDCTITTTGTETCVFTFNMPSLITDEEPGQEYPRGTITWSLNNQTAGVTLTGSLVFDKTATAKLFVDTLPGHFAINMDAYSVVHNP